MENNKTKDIRNIKQGYQNLRSQLKEGALGRAQRDFQLAENWFSIEDKLYF